MKRLINRSLMRWLIATSGVASLFLGFCVQAAGLLTPRDGRLPALTLQDQEVEVVIAEGYAITRVEQVFANPHAHDLEAIYSFPVPEKGTVAELTLWIDGQPVTGEVMEKQRARQVYEAEKAAGREAGVTEKDDYKTFEVTVYPVRAGQATRIRLVYMQPTFVDSGIGRYVYPLEEGGVDDQKLAFWTANDQVTGRFRFTLTLKSAYPVEAVRIPHHNAQVRPVGDGTWQVLIDNTTAAPASQSSPSPDVVTAVEREAVAATQAALQALEGDPSDRNTPPPVSASNPAFRLDKDIVVYWRHQTGLPGSVDLVAHKPDGSDRGTFMLVITPGDDLQPITEGNDWVFVLDSSGSMQGKYSMLVEGVWRALQQMRPTDRFRLVLFNDRAWELTPGFVTATPEHLSQYRQALQQNYPTNGTNLYAGLEKGLNGMNADRTSAMVLVTDGVANVGELQQRHFLKLLASKDVRLFTFIMGNSANQPLLETLTKASHGFALSISNSDDIVGQLLIAASKVTHEALHGVQITIQGVKTAELAPRMLGSLYRGQQLVVFGHYWGAGEADVRITGKISGQPKSYQTRFTFPEKATDNPEIERLWAYAMILDIQGEMADFGEKADLRQAVVDLGVQYGLVTDYTSLVVMRDEMFRQRGIDRRNQQRLQTESVAQRMRSNRPAVDRRVDTPQPLYSAPRASLGNGSSGSSRSGGSGSFDLAALLLLIPLFWSKRRTLATQ